MKEERVGWRRKGWDGGTEKGREEEKGRYGGREREGVMKKRVKLKAMQTHLFFLMKE